MHRMRCGRWVLACTAVAAVCHASAYWPTSGVACACLTWLAPFPPPPPPPSPCQKHYPEMLLKTHFLNCKWFFQALWKVISGWLDPVTRAKFSIAGQNLAKIRKALEADFNVADIPELFGGECKCEGGCVEGFEWKQAPPPGCRYSINSVSIAARKEFVHRVECPAKGTVCIWQFRVAAKDVGFRISWKNAGDEEEEEEEILARRIVGASDKASRGRFIPKCPGTLIFTWDNTHASFWSKTVAYIVDPAAPGNTLWDELYGTEHNTATHERTSALFAAQAVSATPITSAVHRATNDFLAHGVTSGGAGSTTAAGAGAGAGASAGSGTGAGAGAGAVAAL